MGPTASGKSALAVDLAQRSGGDVINCDALQVYGDLRVLSNRPGQEDLARAPHKLFGHIDGAVRYHVGQWLNEAQAAIAASWNAGRNVLVVGGTGLYFKALTHGLSSVPAIDPAIRARLLEQARESGPWSLHQRLKEVDPASAARLASTDRARILRALEVVLSTGRALPDFHGQTHGALAPDAWCGLCLAPDRAHLQARITARFDMMLAHGALDEVARLAARGLDTNLPVTKALGMPWLMAHLAGEITLAQATLRAVGDTRRYAKRQRTWMAHQMADWPRIITEDRDARTDAALAIWAAP